MAKTREIRGRIKAVGNIQRITKTMQMIATARFQAAQRRATSSQPYTRKIGELVAELASNLAEQSGPNAISHPLLKSPSPATGRELVLVITSNRGMCGGYNASLLRMAGALLRERRAAGAQIDLEVVGKKGLAYFRFHKAEVKASLSQFGDKPAYEDVDQLATRYMEAFSQGRYDAVRVVAMAFHSMSRQSPAVTTLLPLQPPKTAQPAGAATATAEVSYDFSPSPRQLLEEILPVTVKTRLFQCFNEAVVGEQIARMVAMKSATDAAGKMKRVLTQKYNRARQTAITTELMEVISGSAALD